MKEATDSLPLFVKIKLWAPKLVTNSCLSGASSPHTFSVHARYTRGLFEPHFQVSGEVVKTDGTKYFTVEKHFEIPYFSGTLFIDLAADIFLSLNTNVYLILNTEVIDIDELSVKPMTRAIFDLLTARGKVFEKVALGHHYLNYERFIFYQHAAFRVHYTKANLSLPHNLPYQANTISLFFRRTVE